MADYNDQNEILEFEDDSLPELPDENLFEEEKPKKKWLYATIGVVVLTLVIIIVLKLVGGGKGEESSVVEIPVETSVDSTVKTDDNFVIDANKLVEVKEADKPAGMPERVVEKRADVVFDPDKPVVARPKPKPIAAESAAPSKPAVTSAKVSGWSVQFGSYSTRAAAEKGQRSLESSHSEIFAGHDFAILAAVLPNGKTTYRLRVVGFENNSAANSFCKTASKDGLNCYVAK